MYPTSHSFTVFTLSNPSSSRQDQTSEDSESAIYPTFTHLLAGPSSSSSFHFSPIPSTSHISEILTLDSPDSTAEKTITPSSTALPVVLRRSSAQLEDDCIARPAKRVAAPSANREAFDQLRAQANHAKAQASHSKARAKKVSTESKVECQRFEEENLRFRKGFDNLKTHYESKIQSLKEQYKIQFASNEATEGQMVDHILQNETEKREMHAEITSLEQLVQEREQTINQLRSDFQQQEQVNQQSHEEFEHQQQIMQELRSQFENLARLQAQQETEILTLRQRLQHPSATGTSSSSTRAQRPPCSSSTSPSSSAPADNPAISNIHSIKTRHHRDVTSRKSHCMPILPNIPLGVVPLAPSRTGTSFPPGPTLADAELNAEDINTLPAETVQRIIKETLQQMGVKQVEVSQSHPSRRHRNHRSTNITRQLVKEQQTRMSPKIDIEWKAAIRDFWRSTYNRRTPKDFSDYVSAPTDLVAAVHNGAPLPDDTIQLDFSRGYEQSRWNTLVLTKHYKTLLNSRAEDGGWGLPDVTEGYLLGLLHGHLKRSREGWAKVQSRFCQETGKVETNEETHWRLAQENEIRYATVASRSRRQTKFTRRVDVVTKVLALKTHSNARDLDAWKYFKRMLEFLDVDGMSSEEESTLDVSNQTIAVYLVKICPWRANEITQYLKLIDQEAKNPAIHSSQGKNAAPRFPSNEKGNTLPKGLPLKMYDAEWVHQMEQQWEDFTTDALEVSKETFEFLTLITHT